MVVDMAAKKKAREERLQAKREAINAQQGEVSEPAPAAAEEAESEPETEKDAK